VSTGWCVCTFKSTVTPLCIVERGMSNSMWCWRLISQQFRREIPTATGLFHDLVLKFYFMLPIVKRLCSNCSSVFFEGFHGRIFVGKFPTLVSLPSPFLAARVPRHWQQSFVQMCNCSYLSRFRSYLLQKKRKEIRCCSHFCRCKNTFFPLCRVILCFILQFAHNYKLHFASSRCSHTQISLYCKLNFYNKLLTTKFESQLFDIFL